MLGPFPLTGLTDTIVGQKFSQHLAKHVPRQKTIIILNVYDATKIRFFEIGISVNHRSRSELSVN